MNVNIQTVHFDADDKLVDYVTKKVEKLNTFHDQILKVDLFLKLDNVVHSIKDKVVEIKVHVPKYDFFVKASSKSFEESFDNALDSIISQIKRKKISSQLKKRLAPENQGLFFVWNRVFWKGIFGSNTRQYWASHNPLERFITDC